MPESPSCVRTLDALLVPVGDCQRTAAFFGAVFGWQFDQPVGTMTVARQADPGREPAPSAQLAFTTEDLAAGTVLCLSGDGPAGDRTDLDGTALRLGGQLPRTAGGPVPGSRGVLGVVFVYVQDLDAAARFYNELCGWSFTAVGRDRDVLFAENGPPVGLRPADKKPAGTTGAMGFHLSVRDPAEVADAISAHGGQAGDPQGAGAFTIRPCRDDQGLSFSLWSAD